MTKIRIGSVSYTHLKRAQEEARREAAARKKEENKEGKSTATETAAKSKPLEAYTMSKAKHLMESWHLM